MGADRTLDAGPLALLQIGVRRRLLEQPHAVPEAGDPVRGEARGVEAVLVVGLVDHAGPRAGEEQADPAVPVVAGAQALVEAAERQQSLSPHRRPAADEATLEDLRALTSGGERSVGGEATNRL